MSKNILTFRLIVNTETWRKEACELIDYESSTLIPHSFSTKTRGYVYRREEEVIFTELPLNDLISKKLIDIIPRDSGFQIKTNPLFYDQKEEIRNENPAWFVYKESKCPEKYKKFRLNEGDIIKIGRIDMRVREIKFREKGDVNNNVNNTNNTNINLKELNGASQINTEKFETSRNEALSKCKSIKVAKHKPRTCRICYLEEESEEDPFIHPCQCSGTMKYIHLSCLRKWLGTQICIKVSGTKECSIFLIKNVECELCKQKLPDYIRCNGGTFEILDFHSEFDNYITLEGLRLDKNQNKFLYVVSLDSNKGIKIGRGHDANLLLSDISVSRVHCILTREKNNIYLQDNDSKFGTLLLVQTPVITIEESLPLHIQVGRTYFMIKKKKPFSFFSCCSVEESANENTYERQNMRHLDYGKSMTIHDEIDESDEEKEEEDAGSKKNNPFLKIIDPEGNINLETKEKFSNQQRRKTRLDVEDVNESSSEEIH